MIFFWIFAGAMTLAASLVLAVPLFVVRQLKSDDAFSLEIYRDQLSELVRDESLGLLTSEQAKSAQIEIERRILSLDQASKFRKSEPPSHILIVSMAVILPLSAFVFYLALGSPQLPSRPLSERQQELQRKTSPEILHLERKAADTPSDTKIWIDLGYAYGRVDRVRDAADAFAKAIALGYDDSMTLTEYTRFLILSEKGMVVDKAKNILSKALAKDPANPMAKFFLALARAQDGDLDGALADWIALEAKLPSDSELRPTLAYNIDKAAIQLGRDPMTVRGKNPEQAAISDDDIRAAQQMSIAERDSFIKSMVLKLQDRLQKNPKDLEGWIKLARSWDILGDGSSSRAAWAKAAELAPKEIEIQLEYATSLIRHRNDLAHNVPDGFAETVNRIRALDANNPLGIFYAGIVARAEGRMDQARALWQEVLDKLPEGSPERLNLKQEIEKLDKVVP